MKYSKSIDKYLEPTVTVTEYGTTRVFRPDITEEERQKRIKDFERVLSTIFKYEIKIIKQ